jgi:hypothetical protein
MCLQIQNVETKINASLATKLHSFTQDIKYKSKKINKNIVNYKVKKTKIKKEIKAIR